MIRGYFSEGFAFHVIMDVLIKEIFNYFKRCTSILMAES